MTDDPGPQRGRFRGGRWTKVSHGLYRPSQDLGGPRQELEAWQLVLPPAGDSPISRHDSPVETVLIEGLPLTAPAETLLQCAKDLGLLDLVVLMDAALHLKSCTAEELEAAGAVRRRGAPRLRQALSLADGRSESACESMLRMLHWSCDVPVESQFEVYEDGIFVARGDLLIIATRTLYEYDGDEHRKKRRRRGDLGRERRLSNAVWTRHGYSSHEVLTQAVAICARRMQHSGGRIGRNESASGNASWPAPCSHRVAPNSYAGGGVSQRGLQKVVRIGRPEAPEQADRDHFRVALR